MTGSIDYADKIDKLLRKASSTDSDHEAEALRERAYAMMADRDIDMAKIEARRRTAGQQVDEPIVEKMIKITGIFRHGLNDVVFFAINALENVGVRAFYHDALALVPKSNGGTRFADAVNVYIVGRESDVAQTITLVMSLQLQAAAAMTTWWKHNPYRDDMPRGLAFRTRRSFIISFGNGAAQKIRLAQRRAAATVQTGSGAELVLRDKNAEVDAYMEAKHTDVKITKSRFREGLEDTVYDGYDAGQRANTGDTAVGKTERKALT